MRACVRKCVLAEVSAYVCDSAYKLSGIVLKVSKKPDVCKNLKKSMRVLLRYFQGNGDRPTYKHISVPARILRGLNKNKLITNVEIHLIFMFTLVYVVCI